MVPVDSDGFGWCTLGGVGFTPMNYYPELDPEGIGYHIGIFSIPKCNKSCDGPTFAPAVVPKTQSQCSTGRTDIDSYKFEYATLCDTIINNIEYTCSSCGKLVPVTTTASPN
jgi:hypothetical protein